MDSVVINASPEPARFGSVAEPWQREVLAPKIAAVEWLAGLRPHYNGPPRFLTILPRGHDKSSSEARIINWLVRYSRRRVNGYVIAADADQGKIIVEAARAEAELNPWLAEGLTHSKYEITGPAGKVEVVPADSGSAFGFSGNFYVVDEVTHWKEGAGKKMWETISSGFKKVNPCVVICIANAWVKGSWQENLVVRPAVENPHLWRTFYRRGRLASWMSLEQERADRKLLPEAVALRVFDNVPIDPVTEAGYLRVGDIRQCVVGDLGVHDKARPGYRYVIGLDYAPTRDRTALCVLHLSEDNRVVVDRLAVWQGAPGNPVNIEKVEAWLADVQHLYRPSAYAIDPYQMEGTCQKLEGRGLNVVRFNARGGGNMKLAMHLRALIGDHRLVWRPEAGVVGEESFADELAALVTKVMPYGWRMDHVANKHDDRAVCVGMAALSAVEFPYVPQTTWAGQGFDVPGSPPPFGVDYGSSQNPLLSRSLPRG